MNLLDLARQFLQGHMQSQQAGPGGSTDPGMFQRMQSLQQLMPQYNSQAQMHQPVNGLDVASQAANGPIGAGAQALEELKNTIPSKFWSLLEDSAPQGHQRLYRVDSRGAQNIPSWLQGTPEHQAIKNATGRWFTADPEHLDFYLSDASPDATISHVDVPIKDAESYRVSNNPDVAKYSGRPDEEYYVPAHIAEQRQLTNPNTLPEHIKNTYLPIGRDGTQLSLDELLKSIKGRSK